MMRWLIIKFRMLLVLTTILFAISIALSHAVYSAPPSKKAYPAQKKHLPPKVVTYPDMAFLYQLPPAERKGSGASPSYRCAPYVDAAVRLQALGKEKACQDLLRLAEWEDAGPNMSERGNYRAIVLCRMLFVAKAGSTFRRAGTGSATFLAGTIYSDWPLEPIILIDQVPFIIADEYSRIGGFPESSGMYVYYCIKNCDWSSTVYHRLTQSQEDQALQKLYALPVWKFGLNEGDKQFFAREISPPDDSYPAGKI